MARKQNPSAVRVDGDAAYIDLGRGFEAEVDTIDLPAVEGRRWRFMSHPKGHGYAVHRCDGTLVLMHRLIINAPRGHNVDHIDGDGLNNRRRNLRLCTFSQNNANMFVTRRNKIGVKGVTTEKSGRFHAAIKKNDITYHLGTYDTIQEASAAYYGAARILWGDFARR